MTNEEKQAREITETFKQLAELLCSETGPATVADQVGDSYAIKVRPGPADRGLFVSLSHQMRSIVNVLGRRRGFATITYVVDVPPAPGPRSRSPEVPDDPRWPRQALIAWMRALCSALFAKPFELEAKDWDHKTELRLRISADEPRHVTDIELEDALSRVVNAIGRQRGRKIYLELRRGA